MEDWGRHAFILDRGKCTTQCCRWVISNLTGNNGIFKHLAGSNLNLTGYFRRSRLNPFQFYKQFLGSNITDQMRADKRKYIFLEVFQNLRSMSFTPDFFFWECHSRAMLSKVPSLACRALAVFRAAQGLIPAAASLSFLSLSSRADLRETAGLFTKGKRVFFLGEHYSKLPPFPSRWFDNKKEPPSISNKSGDIFGLGLLYSRI